MNRTRMKIAQYVGEMKIAQYVSGLLESGEYSDFTITCQYKVFKVHRNIICAESTMLKVACNNANFKEAAEAKIDFPEQRPRIMKMVLQFMYTAEYKPWTLPKFGGNETADNTNDSDEIDGKLPELAVHIMVHQAADMLGMESLKKYAAEKYWKSFDSMRPNNDGVTARDLQVMYDFTEPYDQEFRYPTTIFLFEISQETQKWTETSEVIRKNDPVLCKAFMKLNKDVERKIIIKLNEASCEAQRELRRVRENAHFEIDSLNSTIALLKKPVEEGAW
ncbi:hypothetical protein LTR84_012640 [Exophiala bonariae]|uniref:BTB domain-containing protein n=1 Tax=Exophiala bonariae TaxID=1690606 RepID=A0AAV9NIC3_9EURO|nr:hypothetical protein LTR84_012640 [Exophiala bonariae]